MHYQYGSRNYKKELSHEEVKETAQRVEKKFVETIKEFVTKI